MAQTLGKEEVTALRLAPAKTPVAAGLCVRLLSRLCRASGRWAGTVPAKHPPTGRAPQEKRLAENRGNKIRSKFLKKAFRPF